MKREHKRPFEGIGAEGWVRLACAALAGFYVIQVGLDFIWGNLFGNLGIDFASFWSAGSIANQYGFASVYDLHLMQQVQEPLVPRSSNQAFIFHAIPTPYLAIFIVPFQLLALLPAPVAFWIWTAVNMAAFCLYMRFFAKRMMKQPAAWQVTALLLLSAPAFLTFFNGQANVWLAICVGEFLRGMQEGKELRAGAWLTGLLLKPQSLVVLVPALLLQRSWKSLAGLATSAALAVAASVALGGGNALTALGRLWLGYAGGLPTNDIQLMMNWRMVGQLLDRMGLAPAGLWVALAATVVTFGTALLLWRRRLQAGTPQYAAALVGSLAATGAVAWHSHVHMALMMAAPLAYLYLCESTFRPRLLLWVLLPAASYGLRLLLASLVYAAVLPEGALLFIDSLTGLGMLAVNLYFLMWALGSSHRAELARHIA